VRGRFDGVTAQLVVGDDLASSSVNAEIEMGTVKTGNADRDAHLRIERLLQRRDQPHDDVPLDAISGEGEEYTMVGDLTINGVTKRVELDVEFFGTSVFPGDQSTRAGFSATGTISRKDFGINFNAPVGADKVMISDKVALELTSNSSHRNPGARTPWRAFPRLPSSRPWRSPELARVRSPPRDRQRLRALAVRRPSCRTSRRADR
jgi:polyisoprenoid-binding protein YceI